MRMGSIVLNPKFVYARVGRPTHMSKTSYKIDFQYLDTTYHYMRTKPTKGHTHYDYMQEDTQTM